MNVRLLRRIQKVILEEPRRVDMQHWARGEATFSGGFVKGFDPYYRRIEKRLRPPCGTVGCIYGWGMALTKKLRGDRLAQRLANLGCSVPSELADFDLSTLEANRLFFQGSWPISFSDRLERLTPGTKRYAQVVADRIDHFIATKGAE